MIDKLNRNIEYLRISVTDRCNLRCVYCMPEEGVENIPHDEILSYDEILRVCKCASKLGIKKIKITGGEPLVRKDIVSLIRDIKNIRGIEQVTLTTNGVLLYDMAKDLYEAGIDAINVSLDTLSRKKFLKITRRDHFEKVSMAIDKLVDLGVRVKINCLAIKEYNFDEIVKIAQYSKDNNIDVRFIELMPIGYGKIYTGISNEVILGLLEEKYGQFEKVKEILSIPETWIPRLALALGYPSHKSTIVELPEDGSVKYYLDEERQYYVPKRKRKDISIIR